MTQTLWVALEGADGTGKSVQSRRLVNNLNMVGAPAIRWSHTPPPDGCRSQRAKVLWFALQRAILVENPPAMPDGSAPAVIVLDRWFWSNVVAAATLPATEFDRHAIYSVVESERQALARVTNVKTILLRASPDELLKRHERRGEAAPQQLYEIAMEYAALGQLNGWPTLFTDGDAGVVEAEAYSIVRRWLG